MSSNSILTSAANLGLGGGAGSDQDRLANIMNGGQLGVGFNLANLDAATPLIFTPTVLVVMSTPTMYSVGASKTFNKENAFQKMLKALIETHAKSVTGIDFGYTLETAEQPIGHDGQNIQVPTKSKRSPVAPSFVFPEVPGNLVWNMFNQWVFDIQHPDTNASFQRMDTDDLDYLSSAYSMTMMAIQFDPTKTVGVKMSGVAASRLARLNPTPS